MVVVVDADAGVAVEADDVGVVPGAVDAGAEIDIFV